MASTKATNNKCAWTYTDNYGNDYRVSAKSVYVLDGTDGAKYGGGAAANSLIGKPRGLQMRKVKCTDAAGNVKYVVAYTEAATIWTTPGTVLTLDLNGTDTAFTTTGHKTSEREGKQCLQAA